MLRRRYHHAVHAPARLHLLPHHGHVGVPTRETHTPAAAPAEHNRSQMSRRRRRPCAETPGNLSSYFAHPCTVASRALTPSHGLDAACAFTPRYVTCNAFAADAVPCIASDESPPPPPLLPCARISDIPSDLSHCASAGWIPGCLQAASAVAEFCLLARPAKPPRAHDRSGPVTNH
jgi:hypothetical protein